jgi:hypothetical protein
MDGLRESEASCTIPTKSEGNIIKNTTHPPLVPIRIIGVQSIPIQFPTPAVETSDERETVTTTNFITMPLRSIDSGHSLQGTYGSLGSFSNYSDYYDSWEFDSVEDGSYHFEVGNHHPAVRVFEDCRRHTVLFVLFITFLVILFGVAAKEPSFHNNSTQMRLSEQFLVLLSPSSSSEIGD